MTRAVTRRRAVGGGGVFLVVYVVILTTVVRELGWLSALGAAAAGLAVAVVLDVVLCRLARGRRP